MVESAQIRAARGFLNWSQTRLSEESGVSLPTIKRMEKDTGSSNFGNVKKVREAIENAGIQFTVKGVEPKDYTSNKTRRPLWNLILTKKTSKR